MSKMPPFGLATTCLLLLSVSSPNCTVYYYLPFCTRAYSAGSFIRFKGVRHKNSACKYANQKRAAENYYQSAARNIPATPCANFLVFGTQLQRVAGIGNNLRARPV